MAAGLASIPAALRPSTMVVRVPKGATYGGAYEEPQTISAVRYVRRAALGKNEYRLQDGSKGLVFVDATSPGAFEIPTGSICELEGERLECVSCNRLETWQGAVHHWEVEVG